MFNRLKSNDERSFINVCVCFKDKLTCVYVELQTGRAETEGSSRTDSELVQSDPRTADPEASLTTGDEHWAYHTHCSSPPLFCTTQSEKEKEIVYSEREYIGIEQKTLCVRDCRPAVNVYKVWPENKAHYTDVHYTDNNLDQKLSSLSSQQRSNNSVPFPNKPRSSRSDWSWVTSRATEYPHISRLHPLTDFKRPAAPFTYRVVSSRGWARGGRRKIQAQTHTAFHTNLWWIH